MKRRTAKTPEFYIVTSTEKFNAQGNKLTDLAREHHAAIDQEPHYLNRISESLSRISFPLDQVNTETGIQISDMSEDEREAIRNAHISEFKQAVAQQNFALLKPTDKVCLYYSVDDLKEDRLNELVKSFGRSAKIHHENTKLSITSPDKYRSLEVELPIGKAKDFCEKSKEHDLCPQSLP